MTIKDATKTKLTKLSKSLCYILRHCGNKTNEGGWFNVQEVTKLINEIIGLEDITSEDITSFIKNNKRFERNNTIIRACYGHSFPYPILDKPKTPPPILYHGLTEDRVKDIKEKGILPISRYLVHLSTKRESARQIGDRNGRKVNLPSYIVSINSKLMQEEGLLFWETKPKTVWLTREVSPKFFISTCKNP
jgi:putative RNA 2'-phosphotransferase